MAERQMDGSIRLRDGNILYANSALMAGDLQELLEFLEREKRERASAEDRKPEISDRDFRTALSEAHWLMSQAIDQETAARMRRQSRVGVAGTVSRAEIQARELAIRRRDEILWLMAGMLGLHLPQDNADARLRAKALVAQANLRREDKASAARLKQAGQIRQGGFPAPTSRENAPKGKR